MCSYNSLEMMNIELTTNCPLRCPQCYCSLTGGKNIDLTLATKFIAEGKKLGLQEVMLSGGETLCYPYLVELIKYSTSLGVKSNVALSGYKFTKTVLKDLVDAGINGIFISLNGSTEKINSLTRDGYDYAIAALKLLREQEFSNVTLNWVMHSSNADDFQNVVCIAEDYNVSQITILAAKPNSKKELLTIPSKEQMLKVRDVVRSHKGNTKILIETCYSPMLALVNDTYLFGNLNKGKYIGCGAGRWGISINVDGMFSPCRHLECFEKFDSIAQYWNESKILDKLRHVEEKKRVPCNVCSYSEYCRHCIAINYKLNDDIYIGNDFCPICDKMVDL